MRCPSDTKKLNVSFRLGQSQGALQRARASGDIPFRLVKERLQGQDLNQAAHPPAVFGRFEEAFQQSHGFGEHVIYRIILILGDEQPGQRDGFKFTLEARWHPLRAVLDREPSQGLPPASLAGSIAAL